ncbi:MAG: hypothetical protein M3P41_09610 [Actinomycetota bacterium]|nr:hypothetical protein [Actinomycetota bacterium]
MRLVAVVLLALAFVPAAAAGTTVTNPLTATTSLAQTTPHLRQQEVIARFLADRKVRDWLERYPPKPTTDATFKAGRWTVHVWSGKAGEIATGFVDDRSGIVTEAWTGPQVAWKMARGYTGAFGGEKINSPPVWLAFCAIFLLGLADWKRPLSLRNVDLLVLLSLSASLWFFNHGNIFAAVPLAYPPLLWLLLRCVWVARSDRPTRGAPVWPVWLLAAATVFLAGFRIGLNVRASNVIDVGFSGVIGADRIVHGDSPYGHFPVEDARPHCGPADANGEVRDRIQTNGRCETANPLGDTYGPVSYLAYIPGYLLFGWSHKWDTLPAVHATSILFDLLALVGLALVGRRLGGPRLGATLAFAWAAWPFTQYASSSNTNDSIMPALLVFGFLALTSDVARGAAVAVSGWTKFASLLLLPLWSGYPEARRPRNTVLTLLGFALATVLVFFVLFLEPSPAHAARVFFDRTVRFQVGRDSPFSLWDWRQYHARGLPDLHLVQRALQALLIATALALGWWPRRRSPLRIAALTAVVLVGFELVLTHWSYLYLPWFFPFVAMALVGQLPGARRPAAAVVEDVEQSDALLAA